MAADSSDKDSTATPSPADDPAVGPNESANEMADSSSEPFVPSEPSATSVPSAPSKPSATSETSVRSATSATEADDTEASEADTGQTDTAAYPPALIATAVALPVVLVVAVLIAAVMARNMPTEHEPLVLGPVPAPAADGPACTSLLPALPAALDDYTKAQLVEPAPPATRAWQREDGATIVLRCGLDRPLEFNRASPLQLVNNVQWFEVRDPAGSASTWFVVDRETYIALTVPDGSGPTPLQEVSDAITANLPERALDPGPLPN
ncbi:DUF3515 family protein [Nocardia aurea]|uniref:DUF3515 family protein n=1 Tax=Nocardia aurea TaxID=2144174 RepID=UPI001E524FA6|nr:DUF3515 family protein [Nocardia aurea]